MSEQSRRTVTRVTKNVAVQVIALASTTISKLLITIVIGRLFGAGFVGEFAFVMTFNLVFNFTATLGLPWALIREVATHRDQAAHYVQTGLSLVAISGLLNVPLTIVVALLLGRSVSTSVAVGLTGLALLFDGLGQTVCAVFNGYERMELTSIVTIVQEASFFVVGIVVLLLRLPFLWLFVVYIPSRLLGFLVSLALYRKLLHAPLRFEWDRQFLRKLLRVTMPFAVNMAFGPIYLRIDMLMLTLFHGNVAAGIYAAATNIFYRFNVVARTINNALMPLMAREFESQAERITMYISMATKYQAVLGIPMSVICVILAGPLINLLYGADFASSASVFAIMASIITLRFIDNTLATALTASGLQSGRSWAVALAAVFNVAINLIVLPTYSFVGAAITTIFTEIGFFSLLYFILRRCVSHPMDFRGLIKPVVASAGMATVLYLLRALPLLPLVLLSSCVYVVLLLALKTFSHRELMAFLQVSKNAWAIFRKHGVAKRPSTLI